MGYKHGLTEKVVKWGLSRGLITKDELDEIDEYTAGLLIGNYNVHHDKKCFVYSKMVKSASGGEMFDSVTGYLHEDYDSAKARELSEKENLMNMEVDE